MSEMDKEAEREKLRKQLEEEAEDRKATQHMSELLLKGATMTNRHCDECGDPLFRHEGREFCPTCGRQTRTTGTDREEPSDGATGDEITTSDGVSPSTEDASAAVSSPGEQAGRVSDEADLAAARRSIARKVTALARQAEETGDVGRAQELLGAVREGAEALRALGELER